jgi:nitrite reductase/ring-hydroxylating ferredoxin subunit
MGYPLLAMAQYVTVAKLSDLQKGPCHRVKVSGRAIGLFQLDGEVYAIDDTCTHAEASLCDGDIDGNEVICPLHFATFDIKTGACTGPPADEDLTSYPVRIEGDDVQIEL